MRHTRNRLFFATVAVLIFLSRHLLLVPLTCSRIKPAQRSHYQTQRLRTLCALLLCICLSVGLPTSVNLTLSISKEVSQLPLNDYFFRFTRASIFGSVAASIFIFTSQIIQRRTMMDFLNGAQYLLQRMGVFDGVELLNRKMTALLGFKISLAAMDFFSNFPFIIQHRDNIRPINMLAVVSLLLLILYRILAGVNIAASLVLLTACFKQIETRLRNTRNPTVSRTFPQEESSIHELTAMQHELRRLVSLFERTQKVAILMIIMHLFTHMLTNLFCYVFVYIITRESNRIILNYAIIIAVDLYWLMNIAHEFSESHRRVNDAFSHWYIENIGNLETGPEAQSTHCWHPLCPLTTDICILGLFKLNHKLWTYLVSFSVNFVVLILQFGLTKKPIM